MPDLHTRADSVGRDVVALRGRRVGVDGREMRPGCMTGIARYVRNFIHYGSRMLPQTEIFVYGDQQTRIDDPCTNITFRPLASRFTRSWDQIALPAALAADRIDVFLSPYDKGPLCAPAPVVLTVHDLLFLKIAEGSWIQRAAYRTLYRAERALMFRAAASIITDSEHARRDICSTFAVPERKVHPVPIGIPERYSPEIDPALAARVGETFGLREPYILYVGNFKPHKNVETLLRAYALLPDACRREWSLVLCGTPGPRRESVIGLARTLGLDEHLVLIDFVEEEMMPALYAGADVFAFPSLYEGFGLPPLEAMACGTPVVSSGATSLGEVLGDAASIADATNPEAFKVALHGVLEDRTLHGELRSAGLAHAGHFTPENAARGVLNVLAVSLDG